MVNGTLMAKGGRDQVNESSAPQRLLGGGAPRWRSRAKGPVRSRFWPTRPLNADDSSCTRALRTPRESNMSSYPQQAGLVPHGLAWPAVGDAGR